MFWSAFITWLGAAGYAVSAIILALVTVAMLRRWFAPRTEDDTHGLASSVITRLGTLHALILALMFAQEMENYLSVNKLITKEAGAIADVYYGAKRYAPRDDAVPGDIEKTVARYVHTVLYEEWPLLTQSRLSDRAWAAYTHVDTALLDLQSTTDGQRELRRRMIGDWDVVSEYRRAREAAAAREVPAFFWGLAIIGFLAMIVPFYVYAPNPANRLLLAVMATFNGIVFFFIVQAGNPFGGVASLQPVALEQLFREDMSLIPISE